LHADGREEVCAVRQQVGGLFTESIAFNRAGAKRVAEDALVIADRLRPHLVLLGRGSDRKDGGMASASGLSAESSQG
jgi:hypothetical protein